MESLSHVDATKCTESFGYDFPSSIKTWKGFQGSSHTFDNPAVREKHITLSFSCSVKTLPHFEDRNSGQINLFIVIYTYILQQREENMNLKK